jgi:hypothetical protein
MPFNTTIQSLAYNNPNWKPFLSKILFIFFQKNEPLPVQKTPHLGNGPLNPLPHRKIPHIGAYAQNDVTPRKIGVYAK